MREKIKKHADVLLLPLDSISPSPFQARNTFNDDDIKKLAVSILQNGLLQPISVRKTVDGKYQLIAGERRLRACKTAGMSCIPAIVWEADDERSAALGILENIQREQLNPFEQARALREIINLWACTQEVGAHRLGLSQSALANKLRILALNEEQESICINAKLTERHARAVLRLEDEESRTKVLHTAAKNGSTVMQTEEMVYRILQAKPKKERRVMVRDVRIFINTINKAIQTMVSGGVAATSTQIEKEDYIEYTVRIPKQGSKQ
ncbi:MAG: ParB/RepB/Spo0J family partition protein [Oscillospiraceae bacterium]